MADQIVIKFTRMAHRTQRTPHTYKHLRENWWRHYLPFVSGTHQTPVVSTHMEKLMRGLWYSYRCTAWTNCWTNIGITGGLRRHRSHFHYWNFDRLSYLFRLERWFIYSLPRRSFMRTMVHTCTVSVCRRTDRQTDTVQPITNILLPPSQEESGIAIATNILWC